MRKIYSPAKFAKVAKLLPAAVRVSDPDAFLGPLAKILRGSGIHKPDLVDTVLLSNPSGTFCLLYALKTKFAVEDVISTYGMTGFEYEGNTYSFDRLGVEDSWYPDGWNEPSPATKIAETMIAELARAEERLAAHIERTTAGTVVNFGPISRTLLRSEINNYKKTISKSGGSFSLTPAGFGTGYRFYVGKTRNRFGQGVPASNEVRALLDAPGLVYDTMDCD